MQGVLGQVGEGMCLSFEAPTSQYIYLVQFLLAIDISFTPPPPIQRWLLKEQTEEKSILMDFNGLIIYPLEILATSLEFQNISLMKK